MENMEKIYCGDNVVLPPAYDRDGTRNECLKCGFGAAMMKYKWEPAALGPRPPPRARSGCLRPVNNDNNNPPSDNIRNWILEELDRRRNNLPGSGTPRRIRRRVPGGGYPPALEANEEEDHLSPIERHAMICDDVNCDLRGSDGHDYLTCSMVKQNLRDDFEDSDSEGELHW